MNKLNVRKIERDAYACLKEFKKFIGIKEKDMFFPTLYFNKFIEFIKEYKDYPIELNYYNYNDNMKAFNGSSGDVFYDADEHKYKISINIQDDSKRQKFTLAHEFGHIVMKHLKSPNNNGLKKVQDNASEKGTVSYNEVKGISLSFFFL